MKEDRGLSHYQKLSSVFASQPTSTVSLLRTRQAIFFARKSLEKTKKKEVSLFFVIAAVTLTIKLICYFFS